MSRHDYGSINFVQTSIIEVYCSLDDRFVAEAYTDYDILCAYIVAMQMYYVQYFNQVCNYFLICFIARIHVRYRNRKKGKEI